jgi:RNA polymerase sigma-70 factor (ECF subfamily)
VSPASGQRSEEPASTRSAAQERRIAATLTEHFDTVWRSLRRFGVGESLADDAAQHVFVTFAARIDVVEPGRERAYLIGIAARVAANFRRQHARSREEPVESVDLAPGSERNPEMLLVQQERLARLDAALATLPDVQRQVFVLYELEGFSTPEIAQALGIPLGTAASRLRRAREAFEAWVNENLPTSGDS